MLWAAAATAAFFSANGSTFAQTVDPNLSIDDFRSTAEEAYVYAFPMLIAYKVLHDYNVDQKSGAYIAPFNQLHNEARV
ncbi:MAG: DUF1254 domain-containing protein, partial [Aestuariivirga sp.]